MTNTLTPEQWRRYLRQWRGVDDPCETCQGSGVKVYSSTATWGGGMGGSMMTKDVCDKCWGSGDKHRQGEDLRALCAARKAWDEEQVFAYLKDRLGVQFFGKRLLDISAYCGKQANKRNVPEGEKPFWWAHEWLALQSMFLRLVIK